MGHFLVNKKNVNVLSITTNNLINEQQIESLLKRSCYGMITNAKRHSSGHVFFPKDEDHL